MVDKNELKAGFSARLHEALDDAGIRTRGRGVDIHKKLKGLGVSKTTQAVSKWLNAEAVPEADSMIALSAWLAVRREWLEYGILPKSHRQSEDDTAKNDNQWTSERELVGKEVSIHSGRVPLLSWAQAGNYHIRGNLDVDQIKTWICCPVSLSNSSFALRVKGDSMTNLGSGRTYPHGCIIFVDPDLKAGAGDSVIARVPNTDEITFKVLAKDLGRFFLKPINSQYPTIEISEEMYIYGKVVGSFIPE